MPKLKGSHGKHFVADARQLSSSTAAVSADRARLAAIREALRDLQGTELIYAMRCRDGLIKIGHTSHIIERRAHISTTPEDILSIEPGTFDAEQALHKRLAPSVARGREYYHATAKVLAYVNGVRDTMGFGPIAG